MPVEEVLRGVQDVLSAAGRRTRVVPGGVDSSLLMLLALAAAVLITASEINFTGGAVID